MNVLVVNVGSSSVKLDVVAGDASVSSARLESPADTDSIDAFVDRCAGSYDAVAHRVVHGGETFTSACRVDDTVLLELERVSELAPLHNPPAVRLIRHFRARGAEPNIACFDTAFHATLPAAASTYAIPPRWRDHWGIRRFGFHGLSHSWATARARELLGPGHRSHRMVICHLGAGASLAAVQEGRCVDTTMGFTPVEGLVMARRPGDVDPGALTWLVTRGHVSAQDLDHALNHESGLFALAGSDDMRTILLMEADGDPRATLAVDVYLHRLVKAVGAMAAAMGGMDALVFTGGVGERAPTIRARTCARLAYAGVRLATHHDDGDEVDRDVSAPDAAVRVLLVHAREELEMARQARALDW